MVLLRIFVYNVGHFQGLGGIYDQILQNSFSSSFSPRKLVRSSFMSRSSLLHQRGYKIQ